MSSPTANTAVMRLAELSRLLDKATAEIAVLDEAAVRARQAYKIAEARAYLAASGSIEDRKRAALLATANELLTAELAESVQRACAERIRTIRVQVDVGRSLSSAMKVEWTAAGQEQVRHHA